MIRNMFLFLALITADFACADAAHWEAPQAERLAQWLDAAVNDALPPMTAQANTVRSAIASGDPQSLDTVSTESALQLARALRFGVASSSQRDGWMIPGDGQPLTLEPALENSLSTNTLDNFFGSQRPTHPFYAELQNAYAITADPTQRAIIAANMERWRWMPHSLGNRHLIVNAATFTVTLWEDGKPIRSWPVVVGKKSTPTPVFAAAVTGIIFNPWWEIPSSIVAESVGNIVRTKPAEARRKGFVVVDGNHYRQRPGENNSLGQMKLVMPNSYNVYLHDTPSKQLFEREARAFSHGCVRVGNAFDLDSILLERRAEWPRTRIDAVIKSGRTTTAQLDRAVPIYISYFTAEPDGSGKIHFATDVYERDKNLSGLVPESPSQAETISRTD